MIRTIRTELGHLSTGRSELRRFGLVMGGACAAVGVLVLWKTGLPPSAWAWTFAILTVTFALAGSLVPAILRPVYLAWMTIAIALGFVMTRVILTIVFFLVITPIGIVMRALGKDPLTKGPDDSLDSYWIPKVYRTRDPERLRKYY
jgi:hypothetical protein